MSEFNVCGLLVHSRHDQAGAVRARLQELPGVEIHGGGEDGKLVVTVEDCGEHLAADTLTAINTVEGVLNASLIYHYGGE